MRHACVLLLAAALAAGLHADPPAAALLELHTAEAKAYKVYRDAKHTEALELRQKPVFTWTNLTDTAVQHGHLFVWMHKGRPEAIGTMFSARATQENKRRLIHEFHSLAAERLYPVTPETSRYQWTPEKGVAMSAVDGAPAVEKTAGTRLTQMRAIARLYDAQSFDTRRDQKWELRLLPTPLLQYQSPSGEVLDGAIFAMVSSAGTDPEVLLQIEARHPNETSMAWAWHARAVRFSDKDLTVRFRDKPLWSSLTEEQHRVAILNDYTLLQVPDKTYMCYLTRVVDELPE